jgi:hypothetical protein
MRRWGLVAAGVLGLITACGGGGGSTQPLQSVKTPALPFYFAQPQSGCDASVSGTTVDLPGSVVEEWSDGVLTSIAGEPNIFVTGTVTDFIGMPATLTVGQSGEIFASGWVRSGDLTMPPNVNVGTFEETYSVTAWDPLAVQVTFTLTSTQTGTPYNGSPWGSLVSYSVLVGSDGVVQFHSAVLTTGTCSAPTTL